MDVGPWESQLRKGAVELAVLAAIDGGEAYGLELLAAINAHGDLVADGALYPLLARLEREGRLSARWVHDAASPHPRKYYRLTGDGAAALAAMRGRWRTFSAAISALVEDER